MILLFCYGTLKSDEYMNEVLGYVPLKEDAAILGYRVVEYNSYPSIEKDESKIVLGEAWYITQEDLLKLDEWENEYTRKEISLWNGRPAYAYFIQEKYKIKS